MFFATATVVIIENLILDILSDGKLPLLHLTVSLSSDCCGILLRAFALSGPRSPVLISGPRPSYPVLVPRLHKSFNQLNLLLGKAQSL